MSAKTEKTDETFHLKKVFTALSGLPKVVQLVWNAIPRLLIVITLCMLAQGFLPLATVIIARLLIDGAVNAIQQGSLQPLVVPILLQFGADIIQSVAGRCTFVTQALLQLRMQSYIQIQLLRKANTLDLAFFEDAAFHDKLNVVSNDAISKPITMIFQVFDLGQSLITLLSMLGLLLQLDWWVALIALIVPIPSFIANSRYGMKNYWMSLWQAPEKRQQMYINHLLSSEDYNKEIKLFNLGDFFVERFIKLANKFYGEQRKLQIAKGRSNMLWSLLSIAANVGIYIYVAFQAVLHRISLGGLSQYTMAVSQAGRNVQSVLDGLSNTYEHNLFINTLFEFLAYQPRIVAPEYPASFNFSQDVKGLDIEFRYVSFTYPDKTEPALKDISFIIRTGETVALVGQNGAGKTTLVKLLTRLYDPDEGEILIGGRNIKEYALNDLRAQIGVIFQDFVQYALSASENIGIGQVSVLDKSAIIEAAAHKSGADVVIERLADRYETILGRMFEKGANLSGGEWQKIALARAFIREARILILDEPTSALDAQAEYDIFTRFRELTEGKTTIFISHRFSTVRLADRIFVIEHGQLIEQGSHQDLMAAAGRYSELFLLQAEAYR